MSGPTPWFRRWFGRDYLAVYPHRDRAEARRAVELLRRVVRPAPGAHVLDLACGAGRHLAEMRRLGLRATGLDLSPPMLEAAGATAAGEPAGAPRLVRGDMRFLPFAAAAFDVVTSYFTSFGYFDTEDDDASVLGEVRRVLRPQGRFLLDFLNADYTIANLRGRDRREVQGLLVTQERRLAEGERVVEKRIVIEGRAGGRAVEAASGDQETVESGSAGEVAAGERAAAGRREFVERVRLYRRHELEAMLADAGLAPRAAFGAYDRSPFTPASPRCIVVAESARAVSATGL